MGKVRRKLVCNGVENMASLEIHQLDLQQLQAAYRQKLLTPYRVCEHLLARIEDPAINCNAFVHVDVDPALQQARETARPDSECGSRQEGLFEGDLEQDPRLADSREEVSHLTGIPDL